MSLYSNGTIKSIIIDPTHYRANARASFRLDGARLYKTDLMLANVGLTNATAATQYNTLAGAGCIIKRIALLDGKTELDSCVDVNRYYGFQQLLQENSVNESVNRYTLHHKQGLRTSEVDKKLINLKPPSALTNVATTTPQGLIDVRELLPLLRNMELLDTSKTFMNLRLDVEFETDDRLRATKTTTASTTLEPLLLCDVIEDPVVIANMQKQLPPAVQFNAIEHDILSVPQAKADGVAVVSVVQPISKKVRGFDNKRVGRLLAVKTFSNKAKSVTGAAVDGMGDMGSLAGYDEVFNVRVNGKNILTRKGNDKAPNARLAMLIDAYGDMASYYGSNLINIDDMAVRVDDGVNKVGRLDYFGVVINDDIQDLQFSYERTHLASANDTAATNQKVKSNVGLDIHLFAEVAKTITMGANGYNVAYV